MRTIPLLAALACRPASPPASPSACEIGLAAVVAAAADARAGHPCVSDTECVAIMGPLHPSEEYDIVVPAVDRARMEARVDGHYAACGTLRHHEVIDAFVSVEPVCEAQRCVARETIFHIEQ